MLIVDNYDSFTYNIVQYVKILGINPIMINNDEMRLSEVKKLKFSRILLAPGWGNPDNAGITNEVIDYYCDRMPILGVCLGMQCIAKYYGASVVRAKEPCHGKTSEIFFDDDCALFAGFEQGFSATRYHSLVVANTPEKVKIVARTSDGIPMALKIADRNIYGVQFHPEAHLTENGINIFKNFVQIFS